MNSREPSAASFRERIYALSLYLYPRAFRREFSEQMRQVFRDRCREHRGQTTVRDGIRFFHDMVRDITSSALAEHMSAIEESNPMKTMMLGMLLLLGCVVVLKHDAISTTIVDSIQSYASARQTATYQAYARDVRDYETEIADVLAKHNDARSQLIAAQFYGDDANQFGFAQTSGDNSAKLSARKLAADRTFAQALLLGWDDPVVLWSAVGNCPASAAVCRSDEAMAHLMTIAPDNAAVWLVDFNRATNAQQPNRARFALARMARANSFSIYESEMVKAWSAAYELLPVPANLPNKLSEVASARQVILQRLFDRFDGQATPIDGAFYAWIRNTCRHSADTALHSDCIEAATAVSSSTTPIARIEGLRLRIALSNNAKQKAALGQHLRVAAWQVGGRCLLRTSCDAAVLDDAKVGQWLTTWRRDGEMLLARRDIMQSRNLPLEPPSNWIDGLQL